MFVAEGLWALRAAEGFLALVHGAEVRFQVVFGGEFGDAGLPEAEVLAAFVEAASVRLHVVGDVPGAASDVGAQSAVRRM